jgi:hypothetical protein
VAGTYDRAQIRAALALTDPAISSYLDLETEVMEGYGDRFRYIPGGNPAADADAVATWMEAEGL